MKQHRPRMSEWDYKAYQMTQKTGGLSKTITALRNDANLAKLEAIKLRRDNKLAPLLAIASVAVALLVGYLLWA